MSEKSLKSLYFFYIALTAIFTAGLLLGVQLDKITSLTALKAFMVFFVVTMILSLPFVISWWKKVDEAVREAHKSSWFWGGSIGVYIILIFATANLFLDGSLTAIVLDYFGLQGYGFEMGVILTIAMVSYGYMAAWGLWWAKRR